MKVLDFGLAMALSTDGPDAEAGGGSTRLSPARTATGVILGTAAYMSPEQARGQSTAIEIVLDVFASLGRRSVGSD